MNRKNVTNWLKSRKRIAETIVHKNGISNAKFAILFILNCLMDFQIKMALAYLN